MTTNRTKDRKTVFREKGFKETIASISHQVKELYLSDEIPWVIGYSGGKDSTATLQLVWYALQEIESGKWHKPVHVISTDTLVENPVVALWVENSLNTMNEVIAKFDADFPIQPHRLTPKIQDRFWVNLIGRGYPAPRPKFRWCTSRLKISPSNSFINNVVKQNGEAILVLGTRSAESSSRASNAKKFQDGIKTKLVEQSDGSVKEVITWKKENTRKEANLSVSKDLDRAWVYTPINEWSNDDVWQYLSQVKNPWGYRNADLLGMYSGATEDGECPLVVDTSTPSCGDSRFGCYVCTLVEEDKSMKAMIQNDNEKEWMLPILNFRNNWLSVAKEKRENRDFRRMNGKLTLYNKRLVHGPYRQKHRENMLAALLEAQEAINELAPDEAKGFTLIGLDDIEEIRRIWITEKHEIEDSIPGIYERVTGSPYPGKDIDERQNLKTNDLELLEQICKKQGDPEGVLYQLTRELLHIEHQTRTLVRRKGLFDEMRKSLKKAAFITEDDALDFAQRREATLEEVSQEGFTNEEHILASDKKHL